MIVLLIQWTRRNVESTYSLANAPPVQNHKMVQNGQHNEQQTDLFHNATECTRCQVGCGWVEYHSHYIHYFTPKIGIPKREPLRSQRDTFKQTKIALPIEKSLIYGLKYVVEESEPFS